MSKTILATATVAILALGLAACREEPTCEKAFDHVLKLADAHVASGKMTPDEARRMMTERFEMEATKEVFIGACKQLEPSKEKLACVLKAETLEASEQCGSLVETAEPPAGPPAAEPPAHGEGAAGETKAE